MRVHSTRSSSPQVADPTQRNSLSSFFLLFFKFFFFYLFRVHSPRCSPPWPRSREPRARTGASSRADRRNRPTTWCDTFFQEKQQTKKCFSFKSIEDNGDEESKMETSLCCAGTLLAAPESQPLFLSEEPRLSS